MYLPFDFFYHAFTSGGKRLFWVLFTALAAAMLWATFNALAPDFWVSETYTAPDPMAANVEIATAERNWRDFSQTGKAMYTFTTFSGAPFSPNLNWVHFFVLLQIIGWAGLLAASSKIEGFWGYGVYFIFLSYLTFSDPASLFFELPDKWVARLIALGFGLIFLVPAYLFKSRAFTPSVFAQFAVFAGLFVAYFGGVYAFGGASSYFRAATFGQPALYVIGVFFVLLTSKDWANLVLLWANNRPTPEKRLPLSFIVAANVALFLVFLLLALRENEILPHDTLPWLRPIYFFVVAGLATVATTQNVFHQWRETIQNQLVFCVVILSLGVLAVSNMAYHFGAGELYYVHQFERLIATLYCLTTFWHLIYTVFNFKNELSKKAPIYYELMRAKRFFFAAVWFIVVVFAMYPDVNRGYPTLKALFSTSKNLQADHELVAGRTDQAVLWYGEAKFDAPVNAKANYNYAVLKASLLEKFTPDDVYELKQCFEYAEALRPFPKAALTGGQIMHLAERPELAADIYKKSLAKHFDARVACNLAHHYFKTDAPDSAIITLKNGLRQTPNNGVMLANMAVVYHHYRRDTMAEKFIRAAYQAQPNSPAVAANYCFFAMASPKLPAPENLPADTTEFTLTYNYALLAYKNRQFEEAARLCDVLLRENSKLEEIARVRMLCDYENNQPEKGRSRYLWHTRQFAEQKAQTDYAMGLFFYRRRSPEMAQFYFKEAEQAGMPQARIYAAAMDIDMGKHLRAYDSLLTTPKEPREVLKMAEREMAMLTYAHGDETIYFWDFADITFNEALRLGFYGLPSGHTGIATRFYETVANKDTTNIEPYLALAQIYTQTNHLPYALEHYDMALKRNPKAFRALLGKAKVLTLLKKNADAQPILDGLKQRDADNVELNLFLAEQALAANQTQQAEAIYKKLVDKDALNPDAVVGLAKIWQGQKRYDEGYKLLNTFNAHNNRCPEALALFAQFCQHSSFPEAAPDLFDQALQYARNAADSARYQNLKANANPEPKPATPDEK